MASKISEIGILLFVLISGLFGLYYSIRLRVKSKEMIMTNMSKTEDQDIIRIFEELENKAREINPELAQLTESFKLNSESLETYQEYVNFTFDQSITSTSNHVTA